MGGGDRTEGSLLIPFFPFEAYLCGWGWPLTLLTDLRAALLAAVLGGLGPWEAAGRLLGLENRGTSWYCHLGGGGVTLLLG